MDCHICVNLFRRARHECHHGGRHVGTAEALPEDATGDDDLISSAAALACHLEQRWVGAGNSTAVKLLEFGYQG